MHDLRQLQSRQGSVMVCEHVDPLDHVSTRMRTQHHLNLLLWVS